jgi:hypothetical protein
MRLTVRKLMEAAFVYAPKSNASTPRQTSQLFKRRGR